MLEQEYMTKLKKLKEKYQAERQREYNEEQLRKIFGKDYSIPRITIKQ